MIVIVKKPKSQPEICEVKGISEINKLVGNVDKNGIGYNRGGSDTRQNIGQNVDIFMKEDASYNTELDGNIWDLSNNTLWCGTVAFAGYSQDKKDEGVEDGAVSLTLEQIKHCLDFIEKQAVDENSVF